MSILSVLTISGCQSGTSEGPKAERVKSDPNERFASAEYGVKASPRVTDLKKVPKGGGREQIGRPYKVRGKWYYPKEQLGYSKVGHASWYGASFHGRLTANGEVYDMFGLSAAHPTFPLPSYARVTNLDTGANVVVRVNDRGPYVADRMMDLSSQAAEMIGYKDNGVGRVKLDYLGKAPLDGDDTPMLMASFRPGNVAPSVNDGLPTGVMLAMNETPKQTFAAPKPSLSATSLPGVRPAAGSGDVTTIDAIIGSSLTGTAAGAVAHPKPKRTSYEMTIASYAPRTPAPSGAVAALGAFAGSRATSARIEIGAVHDQGVLDAVRSVAAKHGRMVADPDGEGVSYALQLSDGESTDAVLQELWQAGAGDAFALRD